MIYLLCALMLLVGIGSSVLGFYAFKNRYLFSDKKLLVFRLIAILGAVIVMVLAGVVVFNMF